MQVNYTWSEGSRFPVQAQVAGEALEDIRERHGDGLKPAVVVEESRPDVAPLHCCFEWQDEKAAELYREDQARRVIRSVRVLHEPMPDGEVRAPTIAYVSVRLPESGPVYLTTARVLSDVDLRQQALENALALLRGVEARYAHLEELAEVFAALEKVEAEPEPEPAPPPPEPEQPKKRRTKKVARAAAQTT
jgi:hypothetical protein